MGGMVCSARWPDTITVGGGCSPDLISAPPRSSPIIGPPAYGRYREIVHGGLIAGLLAEIPGSSNVLERGFVVYSNEANRSCSAFPPRRS